MTQKDKKPTKDQEIIGHHFDQVIEDDLYGRPLLGGPASATNAPVNKFPSSNDLTLKAITEIYEKMLKSYQYTIISTLWQQFQEFKAKGLTAEEMAKQVELYKNVIETKYGVKLCVKTNINSDMITMELLVPQKLFADEGGRENLADALQNIAMFILNMDNPSL